MWKKGDPRRDRQRTSALALADTTGAIGLELRHPVRDCFYPALSEQSGVPLMTADRRLAARCRGTAVEAAVTQLGKIVA